MRRIAFMPAAIGVRHPAQRLVEMLVHHVLTGDARRHLAHPVHVVGESDQPARPVGHLGKGMADHQRAGDLLEGAEMGQPAGTVAGLEDYLAARRPVGIALEELAGLLIGPGLRNQGCGAYRFHFVHRGLLAEAGEHRQRCRPCVQPSKMPLGKSRT